MGNKKIYKNKIDDNVISYIKVDADQDSKIIYRYTLGYDKYKISFVSKVVNTTLLDGLLNYYKNIIKQFKDVALINRSTHDNLIFTAFNRMFLKTGSSNDTYSINREKWLLEDNSVYNDFMEQNKDNIFDEKLTLKFILHYFGSLDDNLIKNMDSFVEEFLDKHPNDKKYSIKNCYENENTDTLYYCIPVMSLLSPNEIKFMVKWWNEDIIEYFSYKYSLIKLSYKYSVMKKDTYNIVNNPMYANMKVKDYEIVNNINLYNNNNFFGMFIFSVINDDALDYLNNLPVRDFIKINDVDSLFNVQTPLTIVEDVCKLIIDDKIKCFNMDESETILKDFFTLLKKHNIKHNLNEYTLIEVLTQNYDNHIILLLIDYITKKVNNGENVNRVLDNVVIEGFFDYADYVSWYNDNLLDYVVYKLWDKIGTDLAYNIIDDVKNTETKLSMTQWLEFINNYDEYKNIPTPWLEELI